MTQQQIENVPVPTRQTLDLALLLPGTNTDGSVPRRVSVSVGAGGAVSQNAFLVDGVSADHLHRDKRIGRAGLDQDYAAKGDVVTSPARRASDLLTVTVISRARAPRNPHPERICPS